MSVGVCKRLNYSDQSKRSEQRIRRGRFERSSPAVSVSVSVQLVIRPLIGADRTPQTTARRPGVLIVRAVYYEGRTDGPKNSKGQPCMQGRDNNGSTLCPPTPAPLWAGCRAAGLGQVGQGIQILRLALTDDARPA